MAPRAAEALVERERELSAWPFAGGQPAARGTTTSPGSVGTLPMHCPCCGDPVTAEYLADDELIRPENVFPCPSCWIETTWSLPGRLTDLWRGHRPEPEEPR